MAIITLKDDLRIFIRGLPAAEFTATQIGKYTALTVQQGIGTQVSFERDIFLSDNTTGPELACDLVYLAHAVLEHFLSEAEKQGGFGVVATELTEDEFARLERDMEMVTASLSFIRSAIHGDSSVGNTVLPKPLRLVPSGRP